ncbi:hypothetical protein B0H14DRAFT_2653843 [Mycena olivaceomarginata]|nr:hypothetical protein B0H14DRAFT_2653843 [Mycena olivaceomarginata]
MDEGQKGGGRQRSIGKRRRQGFRTGGNNERQGCEKCGPDNNGAGRVHAGGDAGHTKTKELAPAKQSTRVVKSAGGNENRERRGIHVKHVVGEHEDLTHILKCKKEVKRDETWGITEIREAELKLMKGGRNRREKQWRKGVKGGSRDAEMKIGRTDMRTGTRPPVASGRQGAAKDGQCDASREEGAGRVGKGGEENRSARVRAFWEAEDAMASEHMPVFGGMMWLASQSKPRVSWLTLEKRACGPGWGPSWDQNISRGAKNLKHVSMGSEEEHGSLLDK